MRRDGPVAKNLGLRDSYSIYVFAIARNKLAGVNIVDCDYFGLDLSEPDFILFGGPLARSAVALRLRWRFSYRRYPRAKNMQLGRRKRSLGVRFNPSSRLHSFAGTTHHCLRSSTVPDLHQCIRFQDAPGLLPGPEQQLPRKHLL